MTNNNTNAPRTTVSPQRHTFPYHNVRNMSWDSREKWNRMKYRLYNRIWNKGSRLDVARCNTFLLTTAKPTGVHLLMVDSKGSARTTSEVHRRRSEQHSHLAQFPLITIYLQQTSYTSVSIPPHTYTDTNTSASLAAYICFSVKMYCYKK